MVVPDLLDILIIVLAASSLILMARNTLLPRGIRAPVRVLGSDSGLEAVINGKRYRGHVLMAESLPESSENLQARLLEAIKSMRVNASIVSTLLSVESGRLLRYIEDEIKRSELGFQATRHVRYAERLKFLNNLYREVVREHRPYLGSMAVIVWLPEEGPVSIEAVKAVLEAETGAPFKVLGKAAGLNDILSSFPGLVESLEARPIVLSRKDVGDYAGVVVGVIQPHGGLLVLEWPRDFEAHIGVFGPTGKGKTVLLAGIAAQLSVYSDRVGEPYMTIALDPKGDLAGMLKGLAARYVRGVDGCIRMPRLGGLAEELVASGSRVSWGRGVLEVCEGSMVERGLVVYDLSALANEQRNYAAALILSSLALEASESALPGRVVVVLDESWRVAGPSSLHMVMPVREGRSRGLHLIYSAQSPGDVPQEVMENTRTSIVFGGYARSFIESARLLGLDNAEELLNLPVGSAIVRIGDSPPVRVQVLDFEDMVKGLT